MDSKSPGFEKLYGLIPNFLYKERSSKVTTFKIHMPRLKAAHFSNKKEIDLKAKKSS